MRKAHGEKVVYDALLLWHVVERFCNAFCHNEIHLLMLKNATFCGAIWQSFKLLSLAITANGKF